MQRFCSLGCSLALGARQGEPFCRQRGELAGACCTEQSRYLVRTNIAEGAVRWGARTHGAAGVDRRKGH